MIFFNKNLQHLRTNKKMTQKQIANELGFTISQWSNYEQGISYPKFLDLIKISSYFKVSETDLIHLDLENKKFIEINHELIQGVTENYNTELINTQKKLIEILEKKIEKSNQKIK